MRTASVPAALAALVLAASACGGATPTAGTGPGGGTAGAPGTTTTTASPTGSRPPVTTVAGTAPAGTAPTTGNPAAAMRTKRYCEVLLVTTVDGRSSAEVYNTFPLNDCPAAQWAALDPAAIARDANVTLAVLNGPRYWLMDRIEKEGATSGGRKAFGGMDMYRQANVDVGSLADAARTYQPHAVDRRTVFVYAAGSPVYELVDPQGHAYVMQSWSQQRDPALTEGDLPGLATRLRLPAGWTYRSRTLPAELRVDTTSAPAQVLQDDLGNSYSLETAA